MRKPILWDEITVLHKFNTETQEPKCWTRECYNCCLEFLFLFSPKLFAELTECFSQLKKKKLKKIRLSGKKRFSKATSSLFGPQMLILKSLFLLIRKQQCDSFSASKFNSSIQKYLCISVMLEFFWLGCLYIHFCDVCCIAFFDALL